LRDIVDYELIVTMALLETAAEQREQLLRQIYEVNRATVEGGAKREPSAIIIQADKQHDPNAASRLIERLLMGGVEVYLAQAEFEADEKKYSAGTFVIPMNQVFARYAKDLLEKQTYPEVRRGGPSSPPEPRYDVTAWSLGMQMGVEVKFIKKALPASLELKRITEASLPRLAISARDASYEFEYRGQALIINRLLKQGIPVALVRQSLNSGGSVVASVDAGVARDRLEGLASGFNVTITDNRSMAPRGARRTAGSLAGRATGEVMALNKPRIGLYQPWTANMDEGWTRWVLEQHEFAYTTLHNADIKSGKLRERFDAIVLPDQQPRDFINGYDFRTIRPEYRGGVGDEGVTALKEFVAAGGTLITLGSSCDLAIDKFPIPVRNLKRQLTRDQHFAPGAIVRIQVDNTHPIGFGMSAETYGFYNNSPFFELVEGFASQRAAVAVRYPNSEVVASGWLKGEELMAGRAAVVVVDTNPGRIVLFGLRPQHRAQTEATFPLLFNALYLAAQERGRQL
jgi:hypothetical protein